MSNIKSDFFETGEKLAELYNLYLDNQKRSIINEIMAINKMIANTEELRKYITTFLGSVRGQELNDSAIKSLAEIRANYLYNNLLGLGNRIETLPLKIIVQYLKFIGK